MSGVKRVIKKVIGKTDSDKRDPEFIRQYQLWVAAQGDKTHRLQYDLDDRALVVDLGGYEGQWTSDIFAMYCCKVLVFEPVAEFAKQIRARFAKNNSIQVFQYGLASTSQEVQISVEANISSIYKTAEVMQQISLIKASDFFEEHGITGVDLMKVNIEGGEYDLLDHLIDSGFISRVHDLQVQFHNFVPNAELRMRQIQEKLSNTHLLTYQYRFVWENWRLKITELP